VADFVDDGLEEDKRRGEGWGFKQVHLMQSLSFLSSMFQTCIMDKSPGQGRHLCPGGQSETGRRFHGPARLRRRGALAAQWSHAAWSRECSRGFRRRRRPGGSARAGLVHTVRRKVQKRRLVADGPLMTLPRAVFLKNLRWVTAASSRARLRMVISTMRSEMCQHEKHNQKSKQRRIWPDIAEPGRKRLGSFSNLQNVLTTQRKHAITKLVPSQHCFA
jgi:hypothetical protein